MSLVLIGHSYSMITTSVASNLLYITNLLYAPWIAIIVNATFSVDSFFFLSGLLSFYLLSLKMHPRQGKTNFLLIYLHRYIRLLPIMVFTILFFTYILPEIGQGPAWGFMYAQKEVCKQHWWLNLLYINNMWAESNTCIGWVWYLANDMQFFLISPLIVLLYCKNRKMGFILLWLLVFISCLLTFILGFVYKLSGAIQMGVEQGDQFNIVYSKPWC